MNGDKLVLIEINVNYFTDPPELIAVLSLLHFVFGERTKHFVRRWAHGAIVSGHALRQHANCSALVSSSDSLASRRAAAATA